MPRACKTVAVTAGYMHAEPRREFYAKMDAANVDLKALHRRVLLQAHRRPPAAGARHAGLPEARDRRLVRDHHAADSRARTIPTPRSRPSAQWIAQNLGRDVPLHFTAFHPDWKMRDVPATPAATLDARARNRAARRPALRLHRQRPRRRGRHHLLPGCGEAVIVRDWYDIRAYHLTDEGACGFCGHQLAGRYGKFGKPFGARRIPVRLALGA